MRVARISRLAMFTVLLNLACLLLLEFGVRGVLAIESGWNSAMAYGFDAQIEAFPGRPVHLVRIPAPPVAGGQAPQGVDPEVLLTPFEAAVGERLQTAFAFGGSTTAGRHCSGAASSWPSELALLVPGLAIANFAVPGTNSERSLDSLRIELSQTVSDLDLLAQVKRPEFFSALDGEERDQLASAAPDLVLWANWINERNVLVQGSQVHFDRRDLPPEYQRKRARSQLPIYLHRVHATLEARLATWLVLTRWGDAIVGSDSLSDWTGFDPTVALDKGSERDIEYAVRATVTNLRAAHDLANKQGTRLAIVRPPISWPLFEANSGRKYTVLTRRWNHLLFEAVVDMAPKLGVDVLDAHGWVEEQGIRLDFFCDGVHMTRAGHRMVAQGVFELGREAGLF